MNDNSSINILSTSVGIHSPPGPPEVADQCIVSFHSPSSPTQYRILDGGSVIFQPVLSPLSIEPTALNVAPPIPCMCFKIRYSQFNVPEDLLMLA